MQIAEPATLLVYMPLYMALENSDHKITNYGGPLQSLNALNKGTADVMLGDPFLFDYFDYNKANLVIVAGFIRKVIHSLISFDPFTVSATKQNLFGKTILTYQKPSTSYFLYQRLRKEFSVGPNIEAQFNTELGALLRQEADLGIVLEPNTTYALNNGAKELIDFNNESSVTTALCMKLANYTKIKKEVNGLLSNLKESISIFQNDSKITLKMSQKQFPLVDQAILKKSLERIRKADIYCENLKFNGVEIEYGLKLRQLDLTLKDVKKYLI